MTLLLLVMIFGCSKKLEILKIVELKNYPSGSGMTLIKNQLFLIGDDATYITILDTSLRIVDSILLINYKDKRIPKDIKPDLEAAATLYIEGKPYGLFLGSGSLKPFRDYGYLVNPGNKQILKINLQKFYNQLKYVGVEDINIEGATALPGGLLLANRGNKSNRLNQLIYTNARSVAKTGSAILKVIKVGTNTDTSSFAGVSGLDYSRKQDKLWLSVSTENTANSIDDGEIGKSYLWMINDISAKRRLSAINPSKIFDLEELDNRFKGEKIESVCVVAHNKNSTELVLVSDNDKGTSKLFKIKLTY
ncbi:MAG: hypothetical protein ABIR81_00820 [Ginsengibacter sp.]